MRYVRLMISALFMCFFSIQIDAAKYGDCYSEEYLVGYCITTPQDCPYDRLIANDASGQCMVLSSIIHVS